jgi:hypothetical protein
LIQVNHKNPLRRDNLLGAANLGVFAARLPNHLEPAGADMGHAVSSYFGVIVYEATPARGELHRDAGADDGRGTVGLQPR